ncbi:MAG: hypothetical protein KA100_00610 [Rickettsiales bacterium]|nr:hypothetical protein [Rickettsiales bacterium]
MTKEKSHKFRLIILAFGMFLFFSCAPKVTYVSSAPAVSNSYDHYPKTYRPYYRPSSRIYNVPYNFPPRNYSPYYDFDSYYVPTTQYRNVEQNNSESSNKF